MGVCVHASAQTDTIRYVRTSDKGGAYSNDGLSWATAKDNLQDAINNLRDYLLANNLTSGSVYVAAGTYVPTESTEATGGSMLNTSFKIYAGIHVYGGFDPNNPESRPGLRKMINGKTCDENWSRNETGTTDATEIAAQWDLQHKTILTGNHANTPPTYTFDPVRGRYNTTYPASSFHVIWFATNGVFETSDENLAGYYRPLAYPASVNGCVISSGNASSRNTTFREHTGYGGGAYMVGNSELRNCIVERCNATLGGGGIYLDGGGVVEFCYVHTCQSTGVGVVEGYGGGVLVDYDGQVGHSHITSCAARCGGGLSISHIHGEYPVQERIAAHIMAGDTARISYYSPFATACVINNNTAMAEGGGIYLAEGGTINHCTVTANNCIGPDVTYYGRRHGRTGGIYIRDCGMIFNSVFWGNKCATNNDIQFASIRQSEDDEHQVYVYHSAFMNHDISDWTGVSKEMVFSLDKQNMPTEGATTNFPCFFKPTVVPLKWDSVNATEGIYGAGVFATLRPIDIPGPRIWHLTSYSALDQKGVQVTDAVQDVSEWIRHTHTDYGVVTNPFEPVSTLGALVRKPDPISYALVAPQGAEGRVEGAGSTLIPTIFIDPNRPGVYVDGKFVPQDIEGNSWTTPLKDMGEAIMFFRKYLVDDDGGNHHYMIPALDGDGKATGTLTQYDYIQILVKEGKITTAGPGNYLDRNIRSAAIRVDSHMRLYGGYKSDLTGTDTSKRNPRNNVTTITANITGIGGVQGYENNAAHVIAMVNVEHAIVDGFTLADANTHNVYLSNSAHAGGGVLLNNGTVDQSKRIHMTGNQLRNCVITNCSSPKGAAVYVNGEFLNADGDVCYAELKMINCVVRNNTADYEGEGGTIDDHGIVTANGRAYIEMEHCDIVNNVGYPFKADDKQTDDDTQPITCVNPEHYGHILHGFIRVNNSIIFCNGSKPLDNRGELGTTADVMSVFPDGQDYVFGEHNMFDSDLCLQKLSTDKPHGFFKTGFTYTVPSGFLPEGSSFGNSLNAPLPSEKFNEAIFTRTNSNDPTYPTFVNPSRNVGHSPAGDKPLYGGTVSYAPTTTNPCVNAAYVPDYDDNDYYDRTDNCTRDRGGAPDVGAIENTDLPPDGAIIYVTPDGAGKRDGSSWSNAIAGNTVYMLSDVTGPALATGDQIDSEPTCDRVLDSEGNPVLTTDPKYCGGFGQSYITSSKIGTSATTVTNTWTTEVNNYVNGPRDGESEGSHDDDPTESEETVIVDAGTDDPDFVAGWDYDSRYPYGEISGASRTFWRANPYTGQASDYSTFVQFINAENENGWINNTRAERYVSGLQYAVEKASAANQANVDDTIQIWVGAGKYTDYKGFVMRDQVTVLGGFPTGKYAAPGMNERQALMDTVVSIPKSLPAKDFNAEDYETILQISDVNPNNNNTFNTDAVKFKDNDLSRSQMRDTRSYEYKAKHITNTYTYVHETDNTNKYFQYPSFASGSNLREQSSPIDSTQYLYGAQMTDKDYWHILYPNTKTYYHVNREWRTDKLTIYDYDSPNSVVDNAAAGTYRWIRLGNGSLTGLKMWQTLRNLEDGTHTLTFDLSGGYRTTDGKFDVTTPCGIYLHILDAEGTDLITPVLLKCRGNTLSDGTANNVRARAFRKTVTFTTSSTQNVTVFVEVLDGMKNTKSADANYGTDDGRDPDYIPWYYKYDAGTEENPDTKKDWGTKNPNRREFFVTNFKLITQTDSYALTNSVETVNDTVVANPKDDEIRTVDTYNVTKERSTLRKRVLTMPDVCVPTYGAGGIGDPVGMTFSFGDKLPHSDRVTGATKALRTATTEIKREDPAYVEYHDVNWDGFTIRHGFIYDESMAHGGGAGVNMYEGAHLRNCIVVHNLAGSRNMKGAGIFCDGATSTIEGCFVLHNASIAGTKSDQQKQIFAGGMFMYEGTCFNSLFANNYSWGSAGGVGFCVGKFYNNTIAYNSCDLMEGAAGEPTHKNGGAISIATSSNPNLFVANTIIFGNDGMAIRERYDTDIPMSKVNPFINCYVQTAVAFTQDLYKKNIGNHSDNAANFGENNVLLDGDAPSSTNTPFAADFVNGVYTPGNASAVNDFQLIKTSGCVNKGTEDFAGVFYTALSNKGLSDADITNSFIYQSVEDVEMPQNDVAFAKRVQDCEIDMGAYEFNAAFDIKPDTTSHPGTAIFYVTYDAPGGDASASSPENAACSQKLQLVLDAAGRYKNYLMHSPKVAKPNPEAGDPDKSWTVEVWLQGDNTNCTTSSHYAAWYTPTRSTRHSIANYHDNPLDYSFIVPHGIIVKGGYTSRYYYYANAAGQEVEAGTAGAHIVDERDPLTYRSVLSGKITSYTGAEGQCYHVVTFTDDLFGYDEKIIETGGQLAFMSNLTDAESHRAVLDGLFIEDGFANAPDDEDRIGGGCVVTGYAHIRNCVVQNNEAQTNGGGLYLKPCALVSGTIVKNNTADVGGGMYIEAPVSGNTDSLAHIFTTTICSNLAHATAGGMWFDNTFVRANSIALWHNSANDYANVSGNFSRTSEATEYPFNYCAVESRRLEGQGNLELSARETEGVRWDSQDPFNALSYYPIVMTSTLARAGMTYVEWRNTMSRYTTLDSIDIAGVSRTLWIGDRSARGYGWGSDSLVTKKNDFIEIGARALNKSFEISVDDKYVMLRLYVLHTELINSDAARALQDNPGHDDISNMYRQMGSCIYNPFHRLGDALDYVIQVRKHSPDLYRNARFEIYLEKGTYYPYRNAYGEQGSVRSNTFLVPEAVTLVGGINSETGNNYGQEGYEYKYTNTIINTDEGRDVPIPNTGYSVKYATSTEIRTRDENHRKMSDYNLNSILEPWEFDRQTILSGNTVSGDEMTNVYHVITVHADSSKIGPQPLKYVVDSSATANWRKGDKILHFPIPFDADTLDKECSASIEARTIILDGIRVIGGCANDLDLDDLAEHPYEAKTYFRGGGIFIDGNWTENFDDPTDTNIPNVTDPAKYAIPLVVRNCYFSDNMAANGGAIYTNGPLHVYSSHFTQNLSVGPRTKKDQDYIPWTAGGAIATNAYCGVVNCLFDNNEARRGLYPITADNPDEDIPNADARQGFGGVLSVAEKSQMRLMNCHFVRNKAVAYPSIYNHRPNNFYQSTDSFQLAFNTLFWGNEVFEVEDLIELDKVEPPSPETREIFNSKYKSSRKGVFHYDGDAWAEYEKLYHEYDSLFTYYAAKKDTFNGKVTDKLDELRNQGDKVEGLYFCSYRKGYGPSGMKPTAAGYLLTENEHNAFVDPRKKPVQIDPATMQEDFDHLFRYVYGNNNVLINRLNTATDGPNFKQPSPTAGIDGYMQNADWLLARLNHTTDQGWGHLLQDVERVAYYASHYTGNEHYETAEAALAAAKLIDNNATMADIVKHYNTPSAQFVAAEDQDSLAIYNFLAARSRKASMSLPRTPIGDDYYMSYTRSGSEGSERSGDMRRISMNPKMGINDVYIDLGIYEYQYVQLDIKGSEVDTMWVATKAKGEKQDGLSWETPTTDLQTAIDLLMASHDNHDKYICLLGDEESSFAPSNVIDNRRTFILTSNTLSPLLPDSALADHDYGVNSLNFLGGYCFDVKEKPRDPTLYPVRIEMPNTGNASQLNQLFIVEDMTRQMIQANWQGETTARDSVVIPVTFDGITFINPYSTKSVSIGDYETTGGMMSDRGGAAIYYRWQRQYTDPNNNGVYNPDFSMALHPDSALIDGRKVTLPKLTISNCTFMDNGNREVDVNKRSSAVRIEHGGGASLIVNSVFHSNAGDPIYADRYDVLSGENNLDAVPNDVVIVNSTFALNGGHVTLESNNSEVHNSIIWLDDLAADTLTQLELHNDQWDKDTNKNKHGIANRVTYNAIWGCFQDEADEYHNDPLVTDNGDIFEGPYFVNPDTAAKTSEERRARSFLLNPAVRMMNAADTTVYRNRVFFRQYPNVAGTVYWRRSNGFKADTTRNIAQDYDLAFKPRYSGLGMERGAYECLAVLQRLLYVQPSLPASSAGDGSSWTNPFGQGQIQKAIDVAAVYNYLNSKLEDVESRRAYVFVKGSDGALDQTDIIARDGVFVFGSIPGNFTDTAYVEEDEHTHEQLYTNAECQRYVNYVRSITNGVASPDATPTYVNSITAERGEFPLGFTIENFVISNPNRILTKAPILLNNDSVVIRNCLIADNKVTNHAPVVNVQRGLLYNSILHRDSADAIISLGTRGLLLNNTIINNYDDNVHHIVGNDADRSVNNLIAVPDSNCFARYLQPGTPYTLPNYLIQTGALNYQLHERSPLINAGTMSLPSGFALYTSMGLVNFDVDRDVLGNPRKIGSSVDIGALETWRVDPGIAFEIASSTDKIIEDYEDRQATPEQKRNAFTRNYGGHLYPHRGSVVYLMDSAVMTMTTNDNNGNNRSDLEFDGIILRPAYLLMKPGASFYGNGHNVQFNYLAVEKRFENQRFSMTAFPFNYNKANITTTTYYPAADSIDHRLSTIDFTTYQYNGAARSAKDYNFQLNNSSLWQRVDTTNRTATYGYLMDFGQSRDTLLRFTAFGAELGQYVYTESEDEEDKIVYLTQYDHRTVGESGIDFTRQEDMGWNMKGLPWLVSSYRTDTILDESNFQRQMHIPHIFYQMDANADYLSTGNNVYTSRSWDRGSKMAMGNAFLTQTATQQAREAVYFHRPMYGRNEPLSRPIVRMTRRSANHKPAALTTNNEAVSQHSSLASDFLTLIPDSTANKTVEYRYGRDGVKWLVSNDKRQTADSQEPTASFYLLDSKRNSRISLLGAAPTEVDIPVGVNVAEEEDYTFSLPYRNAYADYKYVWFIDYDHNKYINLLDEDYTVTLPAGENTKRFAIRIDGFPKVDKDGKRQYVVYSYGGMLYVRGLIEGDKIDVYSPSGQHVYSTIATGPEFSMPLYDTSGFFIKVNDSSHKVLNISKR